MLNYFRYLIAIILFGSLFYTYKISISEDMIRTTIDKKLPLVVSKRGFDINITDVIFNDYTDGNIVDATIKGTIKVDAENSIKNKAKSFMGKLFGGDEKVEPVADTFHNVIINAEAKPRLEGSKLSFKVISMEIENIMNINRLNGTVQRLLEKITIPIKKLENYSFIFTVKKIMFDIDGSLLVDLRIKPLLIFLLIPLFLLREIGLLLISFYQKFLSPRKGYSCAKNHVHQNGTCSSTTKQAFKDDGFIAGMKEYKNSTNECKAAYKSIEEKRLSKGDACDVAICAGCDGLSAAEGIGEGAVGMSECGSGLGDCGAGGCDIGAC